VSNGGSRPGRARQPAEWDQLELAVRRLLDDYDHWRQRADAAERRIQELEDTLRRVADGSMNPVTLTLQVKSLEADNVALRDQLAHARANVERVLARLEFLESER